MARGRPVGSKNETVKPKPKNITVEPDIVESIGKIADNLHIKWGFRPTISQVLKYLINKEK